MTGEAIGSNVFPTGTKLGFFGRFVSRLALGSPMHRQADDAGSEAETNAKMGLLDKIENGYYVEDNGKIVRIPRTVSKQLRTLVNLGGW